MSIFGCRYVGIETPDGGYTVWDDWAEKEVEKHASKKKGIDRLLELNQPYVEMNKNAQRYEKNTKR